MKYKSYDHLGSRKHYKKLLGLWEKQNGLCSYTKVALIPGINAHLDHKTPLSREGTNQTYNLHWIDKRINFLKDTQTHEEFVASVPEIIRMLEVILND
jgi:hypothetical protein